MEIRLSQYMSINHGYSLPLNKHDGHLQHTVFDLIGARGTYVNLFCTTSAKRSSSGQ